jgi:hypothetical protein
MHGFSNRATVTLFLDIERAFDKVWTTRLNAKLITARIPLHLIRIVHNYLQNRSFSVMNSNIAPFRPEYLRIAYSDPLFSVFIHVLMIFHQLKITLT